MRNNSLTKVPIPEQDANIRNKNFEEVVMGYIKEQAIEEAKRCFNCKHKACVSGCPVNVPIPEFIQAIVNDDMELAYKIITKENSLPAICGRVCPQENQCEGKCIRTTKGEAVAIGRLERFVADYHMQHQKPAECVLDNTEKIKIAIIGSGPAGLSCASELAKKGYGVTLFEALHKTGGVLTYGIPEFRLPEKLVSAEIESIKALGVDIKTNVLVGRSITIDELIEDGYEAVFIGSGAGLPTFMNIEGESLNGVYSANEFLTRVNLMKAYKENSPTPVRVGKNTVVIGGGNVAMDAARTAKRLGSENVYIVYRRSEDELPARTEEVHHAKEEGIIFKLLSNPTKISGKDGFVSSMTCIEMELGEADSSGRRRPVPKTNSDFEIPVDTVIIAIGQSPNPLIRQTTPGLNTHHWGGIIVEEETMETSKDSIYAGGDAVTGAATVILAMGAGKKAATAIDYKIQQKTKETYIGGNKMNVQWFRVPKDIVFGEGALEYLSTLEGNKATLVTGGSSMKRFGFLDQAKKQLEKAGMEVSIVDGVEPNPSIETVIRGGKEMAEFNPDWIIAIGGGSALDAAKIMWVYYEYPETDFQDLVAGNFPKLRTKAKLIQIPSTSGTASEITAFSVITDTESHIKYPLVSYEITPDVALLDPALPATMPAHITANTGMDVITHAIEAYVSTNATCYTDPLAMESIKLVYKELVPAYTDGKNMKAREAMHNASALAGMAFTNASLGIVHSLAHKIGGEFDLTHGLVNAILLPYIIEYNKKATDKYAEIEKQLEIKDLAKVIQELNNKVGIPNTLKEITEVELTEEKFLAVLDRMSQNAFEDPCSATNPRVPTAEEVKAIYTAAFYGTSTKNL